MAKNLPSQFKKPVFILTAASLVFSALMLTENAYAQDPGQSSTAAQSYSKTGLKIGSVVYVTTEKLNLRSQPSLDSSSLVGALGMNDQVQIVDLLDSSTALVKVKILKSDADTSKLGPDLYVSSDYLSPNSVAISSSDLAPV